MAFETFTGTLTEPASTGNQVITGVGFTPKAVIFWWAVNTGTGFNSVNQNYQMGLGIATGATDEGCAIITSEDAQGTSVCDRRTDNANCIRRQSSSGADNTNADFISFSSDGFTIDWNAVSGSGAALYDFMCLGGDDLTTAKLLSFATPTSTGTQAYTGVGFEPDFMMCVGTWNNSATGNSPASLFAMGAAISTSARFSVSGSGEDAQATSDTDRTLAVDEIIAQGWQGADYIRADLSSMDVDGFTLNYSNVLGDARYGLMLCLQGGQYAVGTETQALSATTKATSGLGFQPTGLMFMHRHLTSSTTTDAHNRLGFGAYDGTNERHFATGDLDAVGTTECYNHRSTTKSLVMADNNTPAVDAEADLSFDSDGFTADWTTADAVARVFGYIAFGSTAVAAGGLPGRSYPRGAMRGNLRGVA